MSISSAISPTALVGLESLAAGVLSPAVLEVRTHTDGGQTAEAVAGRIVDWLAGARETLDLALYDVRLPGAVGDAVADAIRGAAARGVQVRIAYNQDERPPDDGERPFFPAPPQTEPHVLETLGVPVKPIPGWRDLMHHKYVVRDRAALWSGSMNWTLDSFTRQENAIATLESPALAAAFTRNFEQLWETRADRATPATSTARPPTASARGSAPAAARSSRTGSPSGSAPPAGACGSRRRC